MGSEDRYTWIERLDVHRYVDLVCVNREMRDVYIDRWVVKTGMNRWVD